MRPYVKYFDHFFNVTVPVVGMFTGHGYPDIRTNLYIIVIYRDNKLSGDKYRLLAGNSEIGRSSPPILF